MEREGVLEDRKRISDGFFVGVLCSVFVCVSGLLRGYFCVGVS